MRLTFSPLAHTGYRDEAFKINNTQHKCFDLEEHHYFLRYLKILKVQWCYFRKMFTTKLVQKSDELRNIQQIWCRDALSKQDLDAFLPPTDCQKSGFFF